MTHRQCPECDSYDTDVVHNEFYQDMVGRVRICNDCPTQWTVTYALPEVTKVDVFDESEVDQ